MYDNNTPWNRINLARGGTMSGRDVPATPPPDEPAAPLPDNTPVVPLPPIVGEPEPAPNPDQIPVAPLPPVVGNPEPAPNPDQIPVIPLPPIVGIPEPPYIQPPAFPGYSSVRFLHAAADYGALRVSINSRVFAGRLVYGGLTSYGSVVDGFQVVTISTAAAPRRILYQSSIPFRAGETVTMAIARTNTGLELVRVADVPCNTRYNNQSCIRAVNLVYGSPALDVVLYDGRTVFTDLRYKEVTPYKRAYSKEYDFYITTTTPTAAPYVYDIETIEDATVQVGYLSGAAGDVLVSFYVDAKPGNVYTIYILGIWSNSPVIRTKVVED